MKDKRRLTITLDSVDYTKLQRLAESEERSLSWMIGQAVKSYLTQWAVGEQLELPVGEES